MRTLVTGATGFIGSHLVERLSSQGHEVLVLTRASSSLKNLGTVQVQAIRGDLGDPQSLEGEFKDAIKDADQVFHLAGVVAGSRREDYFVPNAHGTAALARVASLHAQRLKKFVYVSSLAAGGPAVDHTPRRESDEPKPVSIYGESKLAGELELLKFSDRIPVAIVRPPLVYGPKDRGVLEIIQTVNRGLMPILRGRGPTGQKYYSAVYVDDLVQGILKAGEIPSPSGAVFYVCEDRIYSFKEFLTAISVALGNKPVAFPVPMSAIRMAGEVCHWIGRMSGKSLPLNRDKVNEILPDYWICSNERARAELGFKSEWPLAAGLKKTVSWYREAGWL